MQRLKTANLLVLGWGLLLMGCGSTGASAPQKNQESEVQAAEANPSGVAKNSKATGSAGGLLGQEAPDFSLFDLDGIPFTLSENRGRIVVLEWFNPECPFVKLAHGREASLKGMRAKYDAADVVWVAVNSGGPGRQGHGAAASAKGRAAFKMGYPILLDPTGEVGRLYDAQRTPHMYIIDGNGILVYRGAIDNTEGGDLEDQPKVVNHVAEGLREVMAGQGVSVSSTEPWGCTVKYAKK